MPIEIENLTNNIFLNTNEDSEQLDALDNNNQPFQPNEALRSMAWAPGNLLSQSRPPVRPRKLGA